MTPRSFFRSLIFLGICLANLLAPSSAFAESAGAICRSASEAQEAAALQTFLDAVMVAHGQYGFSRSLKTEIQAKAKEFLSQRLFDKRAEICAAKLQVAEDIKASGGGGCTKAADLLAPYMQKAASTYDTNRGLLQALHDASVKGLKKRLFDIASGSTSGLEGVTYKGFPLASAPHEVKIDWLKMAAGQLGDELHRAWGIREPEKNPLVRANSDFAREAVEAKRTADTARKSGVVCK